MKLGDGVRMQSAENMRRLLIGRNRTVRTVKGQNVMTEMKDTRWKRGKMIKGEANY